MEFSIPMKNERNIGKKDRRRYGNEQIRPKISVIFYNIIIVYLKIFIVCSFESIHTIVYTQNWSRDRFFKYFLLFFKKKYFQGYQIESSDNVSSEPLTFLKGNWKPPKFRVKSKWYRFFYSRFVTLFST